MWRDFLSFQVAAGLPAFQVTPFILLAYLEYLSKCRLSDSHMANHMAAQRAFHIMQGLCTKAFQDQRISLYFKSLKLNRQFAPKINPTLTVSTLESVIAAAKTMQHQVTFVALYSFCFFSFLRLSNLLPHTPSKFDITRHLARGDIIFTSLRAIVIIKWSKNIQNRKDTCTIAIPNLGLLEICPVTALKTMFACFPGTDNDPLFRIYRKGAVFPLTDSIACKHLKQISSMLEIQPPLTFHALKRAASTWAFQHGVPLEHIQPHRTWKSDAAWAYLQSSPSSSSPVAETFMKHLSC